MYLGVYYRIVVLCYVLYLRFA